MATERNVAAMRAFIERVWNQGEGAAIDEFISPDFVGGRNRFRGLVLGFLQGFPDLRFEVHDIFGVDDKVVSRWTVTGTHQGPFLGLAPTGNAIKISGIAIDHFEDDLRVDSWAEFDRLTLLRQLGAIDAEGPFA